MSQKLPLRRRLVRRMIKVSALAIVVMWAGAFVGANVGRNAEYKWLQAKYGPSRYSEHAEEWILRDFFGDQRGGTFLDVGSYHYRTFSNTYYLDHKLEWTGVAIDAQEEFAADYAAHRPRTKFFSFFVSDKSDGVESLFVPERNKLVASSSKDFSDRYDSSGRERKVRTITLNDLLDRAGITTIDFVSMDIELAEPKALAGFDIERFKPRLVVVEAHADIRQQLLDYFATHNYRVVGRYLRADPDNLWFAPAGTPLPQGIHAGHNH